MQAIITFPKQLTNTTNTPTWYSSLAPFWGMLIHLDMLIHSPNPLDINHVVSYITNCIQEHIKLTHMGKLETL